MRGRCLVAGALPLHDVAVDLVDGLRDRGWTVDVNGSAGPASQPTRWYAFEGALSSSRPWLRDVARTIRRVQRELGDATRASRWFETLEGAIAAGSYDVAIVMADLAPPGLVRFVRRQPIPSIVVSLVALAQELRHRRSLAWLRCVARVTSPLHRDVLRPVDPDAIDVAVFPTESWRHDAVAAGLDAERTQVIPFGVPTPSSLPSRGATLRSPIRLLWIGRLSPEKGLHLFLDALPAVLRQFDVRLTAIGSPGPAAYARQIRERILANGLAPVVDLRPAVSRPAMIDEFPNHDLLLFHSVFNEPVAQVMLHAAAAGLPIVGPASGSSSTLLRDGDTAWCYSGVSAEQIAAAIVRALAAGDERTRRARLLHAEVRAHHDIRATIDGYDALLQRFRARPLEDTSRV